MRKLPKRSRALVLAGNGDGLLNGEGNVRELFEDLKGRWETDLEGVSNYARITSHPAYLRIIGQGRAILPLIFEDLEAGGGPWFVALAAITGADPVKAKHRGHSGLMRSDWLQWGKTHGYHA